MGGGMTTLLFSKWFNWKETYYDMINNPKPDCFYLNEKETSYILLWSIS